MVFACFRSSLLLVSLRRAHKYHRPKHEDLYIRPDVVKMDSQVAERFEKEQVKKVQLPGRYSIGAVRPPVSFENALLRSCDVDIDLLKTPATEMYNYLAHRRLPWSEALMKHKTVEYRNNVVDTLLDKERRRHNGEMSDEDVQAFLHQCDSYIERQVDRLVRKNNYCWRPIDFGTLEKCLIYALARFAPDFAIIRRIFNEIQKREPTFLPQSVFDFGSGVGSTIWATEDVWPNQVEEYYCVDRNGAMLDTLNLLVRDGAPNGQTCFPGKLYTRQFLPSSMEHKYDLVVGAYTLVEMPSYEERLRTVANLWDKTNDFLILIESGNRYGFVALLEVRDYLLAGGREVWRTEIQKVLGDRLYVEGVREIVKSKSYSEEEKIDILSKQFPDVEIPTLFPAGHVYAPCPHDFMCPRLADVLPCKFEQSYFPMQIVDRRGPARSELFSYLVLRKGKREGESWPRIVEPPKIRTRRVACQLCTAQGRLSEVTVTNAKHGKHLYRISKKNEWGDALPISLSFDDEEEQVFANSGFGKDEAEESNLVDGYAAAEEGGEETRKKKVEEENGEDEGIENEENFVSDNKKTGKK